MIVLFLTAGCSSSEVPATPPPPPDGLQKVAIDELVNELVAARPTTRIYNFWASWCAPCLHELPTLKAFSEQHDGVEVVLVNVDIAKLHDSKVQRLIENKQVGGLRNLALVDDDPAYALLQVPGWPSTVPVTLVVTSEGEISQQFNTSVSFAMLQGAVKAASQ